MLHDTGEGSHFRRQCKCNISFTHSDVQSKARSDGLWNSWGLRAVLWGPHSAEHGIRTGNLPMTS